MAGMPTLTMVRIATPPLVALPARARPGAIAAWLFAVCGLIALMVSVGGVTRLTASGLSIVEWKPLAGTLPPLSDAAWAREFAAYRTSPQYVLANRGMSLAAFQGIYWWEYAHRLLGRVIGLAFALPLAWFALRRAIPRGYALRLGVLLLLGGMQGGVGWLMVASGLTPGRTSVEPRMLAAHLLAALTLFGVVLWTALDMRAAAQAHPLRLAKAGFGALRVRASRTWIAPMFVLLALQLLLGAFTAGLHAGHASDTWPLMTGTLVPTLAPLSGWWNDPFTVQFAHRTLAWAVAAGALFVAWRAWHSGAGWRARAVGVAVSAQFVLGVLTIVWRVPVAIAALHQSGAVLLLASLVALAHWSSHRA